MFCNAIITGPTGAIGAALIENLVKKNIEIYAVCRQNSRRINQIMKHDKVHIIQCDLSELNSLYDELPDKIDVFYHLGWSGTFGDSRNDMYLQNRNIKYSLDAVELAKKLQCKVFIGAGSQAEFGRVEGKLSSTLPCFPENGYGMAKLCVGEMTRFNCQKYNIRHIWTRILSVYGPYDGENTMIMSTISKLLNGERTQFTKGEQKWDYLYSKDAAGILYELAEKGIDGKIYCLGSGVAKPLRDYIEKIRDEIDSTLELGIGEIPYAEKQVMNLCADINDIKQDLEYEYQYSFENGIKDTIIWYRKNKENEKN